MKKPTPCPCDSCPIRATCKGFCKKWVKWLYNPESEEKYRPMRLNVPRWHGKSEYYGALAKRKKYRQERLR